MDPELHGPGVDWHEDGVEPSWWLLPLLVLAELVIPIVIVAAILIWGI